MTQIEQIRQEIVRLKSQLVRGACAAGIAMETNCKEEAYNEVLAFIDSLPVTSLQQEQSFASETMEEKDRIDEGFTKFIQKKYEQPKVKAITDCNFKEYLRGVFEANNGVENDPDLLVKLHAPTLLELAQKESADSPDFEAEWKRYTASRKDDMRSNAVTMNVKEVAKHFAEWGAEHLKSNH